MLENLKKGDIEKIFDGSQTVIEAARDIFQVSQNHYDAYSRRNAPTPPNMALNQQPIHYGYGYGEYNGFMSPYGNMRQNAQVSYPGFTDPSYGNGGMW